MIDSPATGEDFEIVLAFEKHTTESLRGIRFNLSILSLSDHTPLLDLDSAVTGTTFSEVPEHGEIRCRIERCPLPAGQYFMDLRADAGGDRLDALNHVAELTVAGGDFHGRGGTQDRLMDYRTVMVDHSWSLEAVPGDHLGEAARGPEPTRLGRGVTTVEPLAPSPESARPRPRR